jgi:hypothetical protein
MLSTFPRSVWSLPTNHTATEAALASLADLTGIERVKAVTVSLAPPSSTAIPQVAPAPSPASLSCLAPTESFLASIRQFFHNLR